MHISENIQTIIVIAVIVCAAAYASWKAYKSLTSSKGACSDCPLKDACNKAQKRKAK